MAMLCTPGKHADEVSNKAIGKRGLDRDPILVRLS